MMGGPLGAGRMASPETTAPGPGPESRTLLASPVADRLAGPLQTMQRMQGFQKAAMSIRAAMQMLARQMADLDPRGAAKLEQDAARLLNLFPAVQPPANPAAVQSMAASLPGGQGPVPAMPPPPVPGTSPQAGPLSGLM